MARVRLFAALREAAGVSSDEIDASTVGELLEKAKKKYGKDFAEALEFASVAVNGDGIGGLQSEETQITAGDEVALLPPVSGGFWPGTSHR